MRNVCLRIVAILALVFALSPFTPAQQRDDVDRLMDHYLAIQASLAKDIAGSIQKDAAELTAAAEQLQQSDAAFGDVARRARLINSRDLNAARFHFSHISEALVKVLGGRSGNSGFHFFRCEANGKVWIQRSAVPANPYAGGKNCGEQFTK